MEVVAISGGRLDFEKYEEYKQDVDFIEHIQNGLKAALSAVPEQYPALREEYRQYTILPEEYAVKLLKF